MNTISLSGAKNSGTESRSLDVESRPNYVIFRLNLANNISTGISLSYTDVELLFKFLQTIKEERGLE